MWIFLVLHKNEIEPQIHKIYKWQNLDLNPKQNF